MAFSKISKCYCNNVSIVIGHEPIKATSNSLLSHEKIHFGEKVPFAAHQAKVTTLNNLG